MFLSPKTLKILGNCFMPICLPQQCLALVYGLPSPGDPLFKESPGWWVRLQSVGHRHRTCSHVFVPENFENLGNCFMPICLPLQCLALVYGFPPPGDPLFKASPGWWVRLQSVGHRHRTCSHVFVSENFENFGKLFYAYVSTRAMPGPCVWAPTPWRSLVQGESRVVGQAAECRPQTQNVFPLFCA